MNNKITILISVAGLGLVLLLLTSLGEQFGALGQPMAEAQNAPAPMLHQPPQEAVNMATVAPAVVMRASAPEPQKQPIAFDGFAPSADSPEMTSEQAGACFSMYSRNKNQEGGQCRPEWYPVDMKPRSYDEFWCASNGGNVEWLPVALFDNRSHQTVAPYGGC